MHAAYIQVDVRSCELVEQNLGYLDAVKIILVNDVDKNDFKPWFEKILF